MRNLLSLLCLLLLVLSISIPKVLCDTDTHYTEEELDSAEESLHDYYDSLETLAEVEIDSAEADSAITADPAYEIAEHSNIDQQKLAQAKYETNLLADESRQVQQHEAVYHTEENTNLPFRFNQEAPFNKFLPKDNFLPAVGHRAVTSEAETDAALSADEEELTFKRGGKGRGGGMGNGNGNGNGATTSSLPAAARQALQQHSSPSDCWCVLNGQIYDLSQFRHSGGQNKIRCGGDITGGLHRKHGNRYDNFFDNKKVDMAQFGGSDTGSTTTRKLPAGLSAAEVEQALKIGLTELAKEKQAKAANKGGDTTDQAADTETDPAPANTPAAPQPAAPQMPAEIPPGPLPSSTDALAMEAIDADPATTIAAQKNANTDQAAAAQAAYATQAKQIQADQIARQAAQYAKTAYDNPSAIELSRRMGPNWHPKLGEAEVDSAVQSEDSSQAEVDSAVTDNPDEADEDPSNTYGHEEIVREFGRKANTQEKTSKTPAEEPSGSKSIIHSLPFQLGVGGGGALVLFIGLFLLFKRCNLTKQKPVVEGGLYVGNSNDKTSALITHVL